MRRGASLALLAAALVPAVAVSAASPSPAPPADALALARRYLDALRGAHFDAAYALLAPSQHAYFRTAANFASGFAADGYALDDYAIVGVRGRGDQRAVVVNERISFDDPRYTTRASTNVTVPIVIEGSGGRARVVDPGRPWRGFATNATAEAHGVRVTVRKVAFFDDEIRIVFAVQNDTDVFVTVLPYGHSVLRDQIGAVYRPVDYHDGAVLDRDLVVGLRLAPKSRYTGAMGFVAPRLDDRPRRFTLQLGPAVPDGGPPPFAIDVAGISPRP